MIHSDAIRTICSRFHATGMNATGFQKGASGRFKGVSPEGKGRNGIDDIAEQKGLGYAESGDPSADQPLGHGFFNGKCRNRIISPIRRGQLRVLPDSSAQNRIDEFRQPRFFQGFGQINGGVDGGGGGDAVGAVRAHARRAVDVE